MNTANSDWASHSRTEYVDPLYAGRNNFLDSSHAEGLCLTLSSTCQYLLVLVRDLASLLSLFACIPSMIQSIKMSSRSVYSQNCRKNSPVRCFRYFSLCLAMRLFFWPSHVGLEFVYRVFFFSFVPLERLAERPAKHRADVCAKATELLV